VSKSFGHFHYFSMIEVFLYQHSSILNGKNRFQTLFSLYLNYLEPWWNMKKIILLLYQLSSIHGYIEHTNINKLIKSGSSQETKVCN
jgi:hypothetical protein